MIPTHTPRLLFAAVIGLTAAFTQSSNALLLVSDDLEGYPQGLITGVTAPAKTGLTGDWFSADGSDFYVNQTESNTSPGNPGEGMAVYDRDGTNDNARTVARNLTAAVNLNNPGDFLYLGFDVDPNTVGGTGASATGLFFGVNFDTDPTAGAFLRFGISGSAYSVQGTNGTTSGGVATTLSQRIILRIAFNGSGSNEAVKLWVDASAEGDATVIDTNVNLLNTSPAPYTGTSIFLFGENQAGQPAFFDNLKVGTTFNDVTLAPIPEPTSVALMALGGGVALIALRRRRR